jgi:hypothetical protein
VRRRSPATEYGQRPIEAGQPHAHGARDSITRQVLSVLHSRPASLRLVLGLVLCTALLSPQAAAQDVWDTVPSMDVVRSRLSLTPEQETKLVPIFEQRIGELQSLKDQLAKATSDQQKRNVMRGTKQGQEAFNKQVEAVLDASQKSEWRELRAQTREKVKERYEQNQQSR